jgi:hypothetical protein
MHSTYVDDDQHHDATSLVPEWQGAVEEQSNAVINDHLASDEPSKVSRLLRASGGFLIAVFIGVGATLAWQSYGSNATSPRWLSASTKPTTQDVERSAQNTATSQSVSLPQTAPLVAANFPELAQLEPMTHELAAVRLSLEQLAVKQDQIIQNITALQAAQQDIKLKMSSRAVSQPPSDQPRKPPKPHPQSAQSAPASAAPPVAQSPAQ